MPDHKTTEQGAPAMDLESWSRAVEEKKDVTGVVVRHASAVEIRAIDPAARSVEAVAGTSGVDRYRDRILVEGYDLTNYQRNPVVQWCHEYWQPPIAACVEMSVQGQSFVVKDVFVEREINPFAGMIFDMISHPLRFIRALSVGVRPLRSEYDSERRGMDILTSDVLEHSWCPIGVNPDALAKAKLAGINVQPLDEWARRCLDGERGLYLSRDRAEAVVKALGYGKGLALFELSSEAIRLLRKPIATLRFTNEVTPPLGAEIAALSGQPVVDQAYEVFEVVLAQAEKAQAEQKVAAAAAAAEEEARLRSTGDDPATQPKKKPIPRAEDEEEPATDPPAEEEEPKEKAGPEPEAEAAAVEAEAAAECHDEDEIELDLEAVDEEAATAAAIDDGEGDEIEVDEEEIRAAIEAAVIAAVSQALDSTSAGPSR